MKKVQNKANNKLKLPARFKTRPYIVAAGVIALIAVLGGTAYASNGSKPGDALYSIDLMSEKVQAFFAFSPAGQADLALSLATERVEEAEAVLEESEYNSDDVNTALTGLTLQRRALADLVAKEADLKQQAKQYEDAFEELEAALETTIKEAKNRLKTQERELKDQLIQARATNNTEEVTRVTAALIALKTRLEALETEREIAKKALETEEDRLGAEMEASEKALEAEEDALDEKSELLEDQAEAAREEAEDASEAEKERLEQRAEDAEEAAERAREAEAEREDAENNNDD